MMLIVKTKRTKAAQDMYPFIDMYESMQSYSNMTPNCKFNRIFLNILLDESISFLFKVNRLKLSIRCLIPKKRTPHTAIIGTVLANTITIVNMISC